MPERLNLRDQLHSATSGRTRPAHEPLRRERVIVGDEFGMSLKAKGGALIVGKAKQDGIQLPVMAEIDDAPVVGGPLGQPGGVDHDPAQPIAAIA